MAADLIMDFAALLNGISAISTAVSGRIYPAGNRDRGKDMPCIVFSKDAISREEAMTMDGPGGLVNATISLEVIGKSYREAQEIAQKVRDNLDYISSASSNIDDITEFQLIRILSESDESNEETKTFSTIFDLEVWASEPDPVTV